MPDGSLCYETSRVGSLTDGAEMGRDAGLELKQKAGDKFFQMLYSSAPATQPQQPALAK